MEKKLLLLLILSSLRLVTNAQPKTDTLYILDTYIISSGNGGGFSKQDRFEWGIMFDYEALTIIINNTDTFTINAFDNQTLNFNAHNRYWYKPLRIILKSGDSVHIRLQQKTLSHYGLTIKAEKKYPPQIVLIDTVFFAKKHSEQTEFNAIRFRIYRDRETKNFYLKEFRLITGANITKKERRRINRRIDYTGMPTWVSPKVSSIL